MGTQTTRILSLTIEIPILSEPMDNIDESDMIRFAVTVGGIEYET